MVARIRLPLQVGTSALGHATAGALALVPGVWLVVVAVRLVTSPAGDLSGFGFGLRIVGGLVGAYLVVYALLELARVPGTRASDLLLDAEGFSIEGGRHDGLRLAWAALDPARSRAETQTEVRVTLGKIVGDVFFVAISMLASNSLELSPDVEVPLRRLWIVTRDGRELLLAEAVDPAEQASVDALIETLKARVGAAPSRPIAPPAVLGCASCGAPVVPVDGDARCGHCGATTAVPAELRARVRAVAETTTARAWVAQALTDLLAQPGAAAATAGLIFAVIFAFGAWGAAVALVLVTGLDAVSGFEATLLLLGGLALAAVPFALVRAALAKRRALHLVTASFGARPPRGVEGAWTCRSCGGALPAASGLVVGCVFCEAENVLGLDLRDEAASGKKQRASLEAVLVGARAERRRLAGAAAGSLALGVVAAAVFAIQHADAQALARRRAACKRDDGAACLELGKAFDFGQGVAKDRKKACGLYEQACDLGELEGCDGLAACYVLGIDRPTDMAEADRLRRKACKKGYEPSCKALDP